MQGVEQLGHRGDAQLVVHLSGSFRPQARHHEQSAQARRNASPQLVQLLARPALAKLDDLPGQVRADPGDRGQGLLIQAGDLSRMPSHRPGGLLIGTDLERITARDGQQLGELLQHLRGLIIGTRHI
jgi:hypothetical protein